MTAEPQHNYPTCYELCNHCEVRGVGVRYGARCHAHGITDEERMSREDMTRDLWATGLQSNADQAAAMVALGWRKYAEIETLPVQGQEPMDAGS